MRTIQNPGVRDDISQDKSEDMGWRSGRSSVGVVATAYVIALSTTRYSGGQHNRAKSRQHVLFSDKVLRNEAVFCSSLLG